MRLAIAQEAGVTLEQVEVQMIMARWVSYWMSRQSIMTLPFIR
jgi:hypothetical protein